MNLRAPEKKPAIAASDVPIEWTDDAREAIIRCGLAVRAGAGTTIEIRSLTTNRWGTMMLFGSGKTFTTAAERDIVLALLHGVK